MFHIVIWCHLTFWRYVCRQMCLRAIARAAWVQGPSRAAKEGQAAKCAELKVADAFNRTSQLETVAFRPPKLGLSFGDLFRKISYWLRRSLVRKISHWCDLLRWTCMKLTSMWWPSSTKQTLGGSHRWPGGQWRRVVFCTIDWSIWCNILQIWFVWFGQINQHILMQIINESRMKFTLAQQNSKTLRTRILSSMAKSCLDQRLLNEAGRRNRTYFHLAFHLTWHHLICWIYNLAKVVIRI